ncbi:MAG: hypothetical protein K2X87_27490 [Gemmataceae bacterium]|nr:hypothetical protein [Gemmataceae bacterium]
MVMLNRGGEGDVVRLGGRRARPAPRLIIDEPPGPPAPPGLAADLARLTAAGLVVWAGMVVFLLVAVAFVGGGPPPVPGR